MWFLLLTAFAADPVSLAASPDRDAPDAEGYTPLAHATLAGNVDAVGRLLAGGARPDGDTARPLTLAAHHCPACVPLLLAAGATVDARSDSQRTPLHVAAQQGHLEAVDALLAAGADPHTEDRLGATPLLFAAHYGQWGAVERLRAAGAALATPTDTALHHAARQGERDRAAWCVAHGVPVEARDKEGTALHAAADHSKGEVIRLLLDSGAEVDARNRDQWTALHLAASHNHAGILATLLAAGAAVNARDRSGRTPLHWATYGARPPEIHEWDADGGPHSTYWEDPPPAAALVALLAAGADPTLRDKTGQTPLDMARSLGAATAAQALEAATPSGPR